MKTHGNIRCPSCQGALIPTRLHCTACELSVTGRFVPNEFAGLGEEDLHFLRIFVLCEGRIREMESALGVSYPTIKARMTRLKETLARQTPTSTSGEADAGEAEPETETQTAAVLRSLEAGRLTFEQAMARIRQLQKDQQS